MKAGKTLAIAWENLTQRKLRTSLTTLGVVIGIAAIVGLASLGEGFRIEIGERMQQGFELDNLTVIPGTFFAGLSRERFTDSDIQNISRIQGVKAVTGVMQIGNVTLQNRDTKVQAFAATAVNFTEFIQVFQDRFLFVNNTQPSEYKNDTIVIGYKVNYVKGNETISFAETNDTITLTLGIPHPEQIPPIELRNYNFTVGGILQEKGTPGITNFDYWVFIPIETARKIYNSPESDLIFVKVYDVEKSVEIADEIESIFPPYKVTILVPLTLIQQVDRILNIVQIFLMAVASISLLVAGIGIMNIMTVSVMERTREIGILKAIGAKSRTVLAMFLSEAVLVGIIGGLIGILTGYGLSFALSYGLSGFVTQQDTISPTPEAPQSMTIKPVFSFEWTVVAFAFAIVVCIIFGLYPARKASKLNPVDALRYE